MNYRITKFLKKRKPILIIVDTLYFRLEDIHVIFDVPKDFVEKEIIPDLLTSEVINLDNTYWTAFSAIPFEVRKRCSALELKSFYLSIYPRAAERYKHLIFLYESLKIELHKSPDIVKIQNELNGDRSFNLLNLSHTLQVFEFLSGLKSIIALEKFFLYYDLLKTTIKEVDGPQLIYSTNSLGSFNNKMSLFKEKKIQAFIHGNTQNKNASANFNEIELNMLKAAYEKGYCLSFRTITRDINISRTLRDVKKVSLQTVVRTIKGLEDYGISYLKRYGSEAINGLLLHPERIQPNYPGDQYQIDGARFNIPFKNEEGRPDILILVALIDVYSKKIVGFTLSNSETFKSYFDVICQAVRETNFLPAEILSDNLPALNSKESLKFMGKLKELGVLIRKHTPLNPSDKSMIENWFGVFAQLYLKDVPGFLGDGIKSRRKDGKPNPDLFDEYRKLKNLITRAQLNELLQIKIKEYNSTYEYKNSKPNLLFENSILQNGIKLNTNLLRIVLFKEKPVLLTKAGIIIQLNKQDYYYLIYEDNLPFLLQFFGKNIIVRYDPTNMNVIYLYPEKSFKHVAELQLHVNFPLAQVNQDENDKKWIREFSLKRYGLKKKLLKICRQEDGVEDVAKEPPTTPYELVSEKKDPKEVVMNAIKDQTLNRRPSTPRKTIKVVTKDRFDSREEEEEEEVNETVQLSIRRMFNLSGSNKLID